MADLKRYIYDRAAYIAIVPLLILPVELMLFLVFTPLLDFAAAHWAYFVGIHILVLALTLALFFYGDLKRYMPAIVLCALVVMLFLMTAEAVLIVSWGGARSLMAGAAGYFVFLNLMFLNAEIMMYLPDDLRKYMIKREAYTAIILVIILILIFALFESLPLKPMDILKMNPQITPAQIESVTKQYGYDKDVFTRFIIYMQNFLTMNFGPSYQYKIPVIDIIAERLPRTLLIVGGSTIIAYSLGIIIGALIAKRRGGAGDMASVTSSLVFYNMPSFWIGLIFIYLFAFTLKWFPMNGFYDPEAMMPYFANILWHAALPMAVLTLLSLAGTILLMRTSMLDVLNEPYMLTAVAKGLSPRKILFKHGVRNAMLPVMTSFILSMALSVGGAVITEVIFSYQGLGMLFYTSLLQLDYPVCMSTTYILSLFIIILNFMADAIYGWLDPRVRLGA